jgi:hypothetical protein
MREIPGSQPVEAKRIGLGLEFLKILPNNRRIQYGREEADGFDRPYGKSATCPFLSRKDGLKGVLTMNLLYGVILALSLIPGTEQGSPGLKKVDTYPKPHHNLFFRVTPRISIDAEGSIYAADNREQAVYKIDVVRDAVKTIAKKGQGPGEVQLPFYNSIAGNTLFQIDNYRINLFDVSGKYLNSFRLLERISSVAADSDTIYFVQAGGANLIQAYSYRGEKKRAFGNKYPYKQRIYKGWNPSEVDSFINQGKVLVGEKHFFYISTNFSEIFKYDFFGNLLERRIIDDDELTKISRDHYLVKGQDRPPNNMFYSKEIIIDACFFNGWVYLLRRYLTKANIREVVLIKISENDIGSIQKIYFEPEENMDERFLSSLCVGGSDPKHPNIYISLYDDKNEDFKIKVFREIK